MIKAEACTSFSSIIPSEPPDSTYIDLEGKANSLPLDLTISITEYTRSCLMVENSVKLQGLVKHNIWTSIELELKATVFAKDSCFTFSTSPS